MPNLRRLLLGLALSASLSSQAEPVRVSLIKTAEAETRQVLAVSGGSWGKVTLVHTAVLVSHPSGEFLFDSGLGTQVDAQVKADMPFWAKPFFSFSKLCPAVTQLAEHKVPRIFLSHGHWDHASGVVDFPASEVWVMAAEREFLRTGKPPAVLPSQVSSPDIRWHEYAMEAKPYMGFAQSLDIFGDGSAVLVPLPGHTPGAVGLFTQLASGRSLFFVGDTIWQIAALDGARPKSWFARHLADNNIDQTQQQIEQISKLAKDEPNILIVPAHDMSLQDKLGYFPVWVDEKPSSLKQSCVDG